MYSLHEQELSFMASDEKKEVSRWYGQNRVDTGSYAALWKQPMPRLHIDAVAQKAQRRSSVPDGMHCFARSLLKDRLASQPGQRSELEHEGASSRRACLVRLSLVESR